jgi:hypothetical protein
MTMSCSHPTSPINRHPFSPGFDTITPTFINYATKRVPRHNCRGQENVNVIAPHIAALFNVLMTQARSSRSWKEARLSPMHKKGPVTNPGNCRIIAVSGTLYRLYANVLRSIVQDWLWPAQQDPRFPVRFLPWQKHTSVTLHIKAHEICSPKITSKHITTVCCFHRLQAGIRFYTHRQTVGTLTLLSRASSFSLLQDLYYTDEYTLLDGDKQASVQPEFGVKQDSPLSPLIFLI